jgi:hypothetical protein
LAWLNYLAEAEASRLVAQMAAWSESSQMKTSAAMTARNVTPSPGPQPDEKITGSWLCDEGD